MCVTQPVWANVRARVYVCVCVCVCMSVLIWRFILERECKMQRMTNAGNHLLQDTGLGGYSKMSKEGGKEFCHPTRASTPAMRKSLLYCDLASNATSEPAREHRCGPVVGWHDKRPYLTG